jgi:hypothetical protein
VRFADGKGVFVEKGTARPPRAPASTILGLVVPAKAGPSGREVSAGLPEVPAFAGMTIIEKSVENSFRGREVAE